MYISCNCIHTHQMFHIFLCLWFEERRSMFKIFLFSGSYQFSTRGAERSSRVVNPQNDLMSRIKMLEPKTGTGYVFVSLRNLMFFAALPKLILVKLRYFQREKQTPPLAIYNGENSQWRKLTDNDIANFQVERTYCCRFPCNVWLFYCRILLIEIRLEE